METFNTLRRNSPIFLVLVFLNIAIFVLNYFFETTESSGIVYEYLEMNSVSVVDGHEWYRLITSMFVHYGFAHIFCNMFSLIYLSDVVLAYFGNKKYAIIYFVSGLCGSFLVLGYDILMERPSICGGASGAVCGLLGAIIAIAFSKHGKQYFNRAGVMIMVLIMLAPSFVTAGISWQAHLGGFVGGFVTAKLLDDSVRQKRNDDYSYDYRNRRY